MILGVRGNVQLRLQDGYEAIVLCQLGLEVMTKTLFDHANPRPRFTFSDETVYTNIQVSNLGQLVYQLLSWGRYITLKENGQQSSHCRTFERTWSSEKRRLVSDPLSLPVAKRTCFPDIPWRRYNASLRRAISAMCGRPIPQL